LVRDGLWHLAFLSFFIYQQEISLSLSVIYFLRLKGQRLAPEDGYPVAPCLGYGLGAWLYLFLLGSKSARLVLTLES